MSGCKKYFFIVLGLWSLLTSCTSMQVDHSQPVSIASIQKIAVLPFYNMTETPQANERTAAIVADLLRTKGTMQVVSYPIRQGKLSLISGMKTPPARKRLLSWARSKDARYAFSGSVSEWNYKVGLDGEPVIGINLELIDLYSDRVIWSAVGSKSGGSSTALTTVAQQLISNMLSSVDLTRS